MRFHLIVFCFSLMFFSCKKEKLEGDAEILVGEWSWVSTEKQVNFCAPPYWYEYLNPASELNDYSISFYQKGKVKMLKNGEKLEKSSVKNIFMAPLSENYPDYDFSFFIEFYGDSERIDGIVGPDTLQITNHFPFPDEPCNDYTSYFVRE